MFNHHHHRIHFINFVLTKKLSEIYVFIVLRALAISMIGIFIPIYLLKELSYSLTDILFFYIVLFVFFGLATPVCARLSSKIGFKHIMMISLGPQLLFFYLLYQLDVFKVPLFLLAVIAGIAEGLFWLSFHINFALSTDKKHRGEEIGLFYILTMVIGVAGPFLGGLILKLYNFQLLFIIAGVLLVVSMIPLLYSEDIYKISPINWDSILKYSSGKDAVKFIVYGVRLTGAGIFWPIFVFFSLLSYLSTGFIISFSSFVIIFFTWFIGKMSDRYDKNLLIRIGSFFEGIVWIIKLFVRSFFSILGAGVLGGAAYTLIDIPFGARVYDRARRSKLVEYLIFREIFLIVGRLICLGVILVCVGKFDFMANIKVSFILSSIASFIQMLI